MFEITIEDSGFTQNLTAVFDRAVNFNPQIWQSIGDTACLEIRGNFDVGGRPDTWKPSIFAALEGRNTLVKSGRLKNAAQVIDIKTNSVTIGMPSDIPYANIHNFRGEVTVTERMKRFFLAKYLEDPNGNTATMWKGLMSNDKHPIGSKLQIEKREYFVLAPQSQEKIYNQLKDYILYGKF